MPDLVSLLYNASPFFEFTYIIFLILIPHNFSHNYHRNLMILYHSSDAI